jgi:SAM-dependent methyltransferase
VEAEILSLLKPLPKNSIAIESYKPNVVFARKNLKKYGVKLVETNASKKFPFKDGEFDLILNRHGTINAKEIYRTLKSGGLFFTQQVSADKDVSDMHKIFHSKSKWTFNNLKFRKRELKKLGFEIILSKTWEGKITFYDVGAIVYWLKATPWLVDNFSVKII